MKTAWQFEARLGEVAGKELPPEEDQTFKAVLLDNGTLSIKFYSHDDHMMSRISVSLATAVAVEVFNDPSQGDFYMLRVSGGQIPILLPKDQMTSFMDAVDGLEHQLNR